jgi:hypothetical protein
LKQKHSSIVSRLDAPAGLDTYSAILKTSKANTENRKLCRELESRTTRYTPSQHQSKTTTKKKHPRTRFPKNIYNKTMYYMYKRRWWQPEPLNRNESGRFGALKSDSTHHLFRNACTKSGSLRFSQFSGCWLILSVYIIMSFDFPFVRLLGVR